MSDFTTNLTLLKLTEKNCQWFKNDSNAYQLSHIGRKNLMQFLLSKLWMTIEILYKSYAENGT